MKWKKLKDGAEEISIMKKMLCLYLFYHIEGSFWNNKNKLWEAWILDSSGTTSKLIAKGKSKDKVRDKAEAWLRQCAEEILKESWEESEKCH